MIHNRRRPSHYVVGNSLAGSEGVVAVTSAFERSALLQIGEGVNPFLHVSLHQRDELVKFLEALSARGFLNRNPAQLKAPKRYLSSPPDQLLVLEQGQG